MEYVLCRHVYHCTPAELREQPVETILTTLTILGVEAEVRDLQRRLG